MSTTFLDQAGRKVAVRYYGGETLGTQVHLQPAAADIGMTSPIRGEDGSHTTLEALAQSVGNGRAKDDAPKSMGGAMARGIPVTIVQNHANTAGIEDALNRIAEELHLLVLQGDERNGR